MNQEEKKRVDRKLVAALAALLLSVLLALSSAATARSLLFQGVQLEEVYVAGPDGARLRCLVYKPLGSAGKLPAVLVVHGLGGSSDTMNAISTELARNGVLVLALNYRGHDGSEGGVNYIGDPITAPNISNDLIAAVRYLAERDDVDAGRIGAVGYSMGSRAVLRLALLVPTVSPRSDDRPVRRLGAGRCEHDLPEEPADHRGQQRHDHAALSGRASLQLCDAGRR
uniref:Alpha/beta fold hydrolase n=1 Tax=Thermofilum pendens TaxID=2269 RepID=A0A7C3WVE0_THEPE